MSPDHMAEARYHLGLTAGAETLGGPHPKNTRKLEVDWVVPKLNTTYTGSTPD